MLTPEIIAATARRLAGVVNTTPVMTSRTLNGRVGAKLFLKCENFQRVGAFKFRGAYNAISQLSTEQKAGGVITHSSGNHAQGVALAARLLDVQATIVMPDNAPAIKKAATAGYGAKIVTCPAVDREKKTAELIKQHGYTLVHPYDNDHIIAGQGTAAHELFAEAGPLDALFVPVGGGGLISGSALAAAAASPGCIVIGVEPAAGDDANRSWRQNEVIALDTVPDTIADGLRTRFIGERNLSVMNQYVHDMTTASDDAIIDTLNFLWTRMKLIVEPSAAAALAPLFTGDYTAPGPRIGVILSGGNVDVAAIARLLSADDTTERPKSMPASSSQFTPASPAPNPPTAQTTKPTVLVCDDVDAAGLDILREVARVERLSGIEDGDLATVIGDYQALLCSRDTHLSGTLLEEAYHLRAIAIASSRLDNVDVSTARAMGIDVLSAPGSTAVAIAEHLISRLLLLTERFSDGRLAGKTLGLIGYGSIAKQITRRAQAFDMEILVNQPRLTPELALADVEAVDLIDLLHRADFVSLHVPFKKETTAMIGTAELAHMPPHACLINTGHTDLIDDAALLTALEEGHIAAAALSEIPGQAKPTAAALTLRQHHKVIVAPHVTAIIDDRQRDAAIHVARQLANLLETDKASDTLSLELVPTRLVTPHEHIDPKRVARLRTRLEADGRLVNPPITTPWHGRYIILDGATRYTAMKEMGLPHVIVQAVPPDQAGFELHTWYHAISSDDNPAALYDHVAALKTVQLQPLASDQLQNAFQDEAALCYFLDKNGDAQLATAVAGVDRLAAMNDLVAAYTAWGSVERTLLTDLSRLLAQFPQMVAVAVFPQFTPADVFDAARAGDFLPAGLTRFVIPGRILRLNADLARLQGDIPLAEKRAWFNSFLEQKLARSRLRYYQEPVILLDE